MSDAGIEATEDPEVSKEDEALVEARVAALLARFPGRFTDEEVAAIRKKVAGHLEIARALHGAPLEPDVEPPAFVPVSKEED